MSRELDRINQRVLEELESDGRLSIVDVATRVNLTNTPCSKRVKRLEKSLYRRLSRHFEHEAIGPWAFEP